ncbi:MAG TPA: hypothetical protein DCQ98_06120 [Planctomycetaceae bacterium]|nr:hypothetical protein [Planctomycetaceae bacterium]
MNHPSRTEVNVNRCSPRLAEAAILDDSAPSPDSARRGSPGEIRASGAETNSIVERYRRRNGTRFRRRSVAATFLFLPSGNRLRNVPTTL